MKEKKKQIFCWRCHTPIKVETNSQFKHQLCQDCLEDDYIIVFCLKCRKELLTHKDRGNRVCENCHKGFRGMSPLAEEPNSIARSKRVIIPDDSIFKMIHPSPINTR